MRLKRHMPLRLRAARNRRGLSQAKLAALAGVSRATIGALEGGQCGETRVRTLMELCVALQISPDYLLGVDKPADMRQGIRLEMFPLRAAAGQIEKCFACDCLLSAAADHALDSCIFTNHERGKGPEWLCSFYGISMHSLFESLLQEQQRIRAAALASV